MATYKLSVVNRLKKKIKKIAHVKYWAEMIGNKINMPLLTYLSQLAFYQFSQIF